MPTINPGTGTQSLAGTTNCTLSSSCRQTPSFINLTQTHTQLANINIHTCIQNIQGRKSRYFVILKYNILKSYFISVESIKGRNSRFVQLFVLLAYKFILRLLCLILFMFIGHMILYLQESFFQDIDQLQNHGIVSFYFCYLSLGTLGYITPLMFDLWLSGEQDGRVVNTPAFGSKGPRFDPRQQPFVQLS